MPDEFEGTEGQASEGTQSFESNGVEQSGGNPAWADILNTLPDAYHDVVRPKLEDWDRGVQDRFTKQAETYNPYKSIIEQKIAPDELMAAYQFSQQVEQDPVAMYERLGAYLQQQGYTPQQAAQAVQDAAEDNGDAGFEYSEEDDPRITALQQQQDAMREAFEAQQFEQQKFAIEQQTYSEVDAFQKEKQLPGWELKEVLNRARNMAEPDLAAAYNEWTQVKAQMGAASPGRDAPGVLSATGGNPLSPRKAYEDMTRDEQRAHDVASIRALNG